MPPRPAAVRKGILWKASPGFPGWFWDEIHHDAPRVLFWAALFGGLASLLATSIDQQYFSGPMATGALVFRIISVLFMGGIAWLSHFRPDTVRRYYDRLVCAALGLFMVAAGMFGAMVPGEVVANPYVLMLVHTQFIAFTFAPIRARFMVPMVAMANGFFLAIAVGIKGSPVDTDFIGLAFGLLVFAVLGFAAQYMILDGRLQSIRARREADEANRKLSEWSQHLETEVRERTRNLEFANQTLTREVRERQEAQRALRQSEARYRIIVESSFDAILGLIGDEVYPIGPLDGTICGQPLENLTTASLLERIHGEEREAFRLFLHRCRTNLSTERSIVRMGDDVSGWHWFEAACGYYKEQDETVGALIIRDITEERQLQEESHQQGKLASLGQLAAGMAHDMNNLLMIVRSAAELIPRAEVDTAQKLAQICHAADQGAELVHQVLDFSRSSPSSPQPVEASAFLRESADFMRHLLSENIAIDVSVEGECWVEADKNQLYQILLNLSSNARDAMPAGGELRLSVETWTGQLKGREGDERQGQSVPKEWVRMRVADTGMGMSPEVLAKVFEPFFTTKDTSKGTGLGLSQVYGLVGRNKGTVRVESQPGAGTRFDLYFPRIEAPSQTGGPSEADARTTPGEEVGAILVVEDVKALRELCCMMLEDAGYAAFAVDNAEQALNALRAEPDRYSAILTDLTMPGQSGLELIRIVRSEFPRLRAVLMTGVLTPEAEEMDEGDRPDAILSKPFGRRDLKAVLATLSFHSAG